MVTQSSVTLLPDSVKTRSGKVQYLAQVTAELRLHGSPGLNLANSSPPIPRTSGTTRSGVGADISFDPDKAVKTAQAEAFKKAAHQFGVALELWDEDHRASLETARKAAGGSEAALKKSVFDLAKERLGKAKPTVAEVAKCFDVQPEDLQDADTLRELLTREGVL